MKTRILLCSVPSDAHQWNLIFLRLWLQEHGCEVVCPGVCMSSGELAELAEAEDPDLVVVSTINGHGGLEGLELIELLKRRRLRAPVLIGGKLATSPAAGEKARADLLEAGYAAVLTGEGALEALERLLTVRAGPACAPQGRIAVCSQFGVAGHGEGGAT